MSAFVAAAAISFAIIFVAELGDKSQLMALAFATRYRPSTVLIGITVATAAAHALFVGVGYGLGAALPTDWISVAAALAFFGFGAWTLRGDALSDNDQQRVARAGRSPTLAVGIAFFLAELGDKTMLVTMTLATQYGWLGTWLGSTVGMIAADAIAIAIGHRLGKRVPQKAIRYGAAALFGACGVWLLLEALL